MWNLENVLQPLSIYNGHFVSQIQTRLFHQWIVAIIMPSQLAGILVVGGVVLSTIMTLALTASIALVFTIGKPTAAPTVVVTTAPVLAEPCACGCPAITPQITPRIVNGEGAIPNSWPWQLLLINFNSIGIPQSYCGASLITPKHVLTAAHCIFGWSPRYVGVIPRLHAFNISSWSPSIAIMAERIYAHESYDDFSLNDDIAVIRLRTAMPLDDQVNLVCLAPPDLGAQALVPGEALVATGWGALESANRSRPSVLQQVSLQYVDPANPLCSPLIGIDENQRLGQMCAGFPPRAICFGDSGGPLVRRITHSNGQQYWQQVGVVSGTVDCGYQTNYSDVYARVTYYNRWIVDKILLSPWNFRMNRACQFRFYSLVWNEEKHRTERKKRKRNNNKWNNRKKNINHPKTRTCPIFRPPFWIFESIVLSSGWNTWRLRRGQGECTAQRKWASLSLP